ncbi:hypothetical protein HYH02_013459 [Chlamydomonas schloesseri]|uniref:ABC transporter domain-containing protein n=1 Tax=Chlamydomonas schloesseri TaxID=2026947 RepID=A0A835ST77_9CHLO|nr:hypothetical protein HYH02_013459 [Chlamydomonas schloesseri]|eukprot:KAG2431027.1 hypothetical protein HYH02_013459 [Chlamydomonas schloesseri]
MGKDDAAVANGAAEAAKTFKVSDKKKPPIHHLTSLARQPTQASLLRSIEKSSQVTVEFNEVCAWVPTLVLPGGGGPGKVGALLAKCKGGDGGTDVEAPKAPPPKERQVLFNISGEVTPGEVLALMGPSGGGKTSLLTLLGGRSTARLGGTISFNGAKMTKATKRKMGYVSQDDLLYAELTVYETLYFAALLRLPRSWSRADKLSRVEMVVEGLGLDRCRDTIIGSHMMRGVSGGERKRVSIGHELLINPSMLLLDEPTSGLDSTTALRLMHTLRTLASGGRTIITSIHQPSSRLYRQMDKLMLLSEGRCMYYGDAQGVATWFKLLGQPCPFGTNIADHILDLANGDVLVGGGNSASVGSGLDMLGLGVLGGADGVEGGAAVTARDVHQSLVAAFEQRKIGRGRGGIRPSDLEAMAAAAEAAAAAAGGTPRKGDGGSGDGDSEDAAASSGDQALSATAVKAEVEPAGGRGLELAAPAAPAPAPAGGEESKWGATWFDQIKILVVRCVKTRRFQSLSNQKFIQLIGVAVLAGMFWWQIGADLHSNQAALDVGGLLFFIELFMGFASLFAALFTFPAEFQMLVKERQSGMYRLSAFYVARTLSDLPMDCLLPSLFTWIVYFMGGLRLNAGAFFANWASVLLIVLTSQSVGLLIGATVMNPMNGQTVATIFMLSTMLVGGYYVRGIPVWISWLKYVSFIYWGWNLLLKIEFSNRAFPCSAIDAGSAAGNATLEALAQSSGGVCSVRSADIFEVDVDEPVTKEVCILIAMFIFLRLCIYYALQYKTTFKGRK